MENSANTITTHVSRLEEVTGMAMRLCVEWSDPYALVPEDFMHQRTAKRIIDYLSHVQSFSEIFPAESGVVPMELAAERRSLCDDMEATSMVIGALLEATLACSPRFRDKVRLIPPRPKSIESTKEKIGRRVSKNPPNFKPISDFYAAQIIPRHEEDDVIDEAADQDLIYDALVYIRDTFRVPVFDVWGEEAIDFLGNENSDTSFQGLQEKLYVVINGEAELFEVQGLTTTQLAAYKATRSAYEEARRSRDGGTMFHEKVLGSTAIKQMVTTP